MTLLEQERTLKRMEGRAFQHSLEGRYDLSPEMLDCIDFQTGKENQTLSFPILNLSGYVQDRCRRFPDWAELLTGASQAKSPEGLQGVLYTDEVVPGNVLRPDNARRSYLFYFTWADLKQATRSEFSWIVLFVIRTSRLKEIAGGLAAVTRAVVAHLETAFAGFAVADARARSHLIRTTCCYLLADESALKGAVGAKGSSGLRPCILCENALDKSRQNIEGHANIACHHFNNFRPMKQSQLDIYMAHLATRPNKSQLEDSQTLLGWRWIPQSIVCQPGFLIAERCIYDSMHCYWSQGTIGCEVGLFLQSAKMEINFSPAELAELAGLPWTSHTRKASAVTVLNEKLLQPGVDYKGDAKQTLVLLPLLNYYAQKVLAAKLPSQVDCLRRLNKVCRKILTLKNNTACVSQADVDSLLRLQEQHLQAFKDCYGADQVRPKHHYGFHTSQPAVSMQVFLDCFVCERKNKNFKTQIRGSDSLLTHFEKTAMATLLSHDRKWVGNWSSQPVLSRPQKKAGGETMYAEAQWKGENFPSAAYILSETVAVTVLGFVEDPEEAVAVAARMSCKDWKFDYSTWTKQVQQCSLKLSDLRFALRPAWTLEEGSKITLVH